MEEKPQGRPPYIANLADCNRYNDPETPLEWKKGIDGVYRVLYTLLNGQKVNFKASPHEYGIAMSALPRRMKDIRDKMGAIVEPGINAKLDKEYNADGTHYYLRNYWMTPENIERFKRENFGVKTNWDKKKSKKVSTPALSAC